MKKVIILLFISTCLFTSCENKEQKAARENAEKAQDAYEKQVEKSNATVDSINSIR